MARRRMLSIALMESDGFYDLCPMTQLLYVHLNLNADDDGLVDKVRSIMRTLKASSKNQKQLIEEGYIIELSPKVIAITHWRQHNPIKSDRYTPTTYGGLMKLLGRDENSIYFKLSEDIFGDKCAPQDSIVKDSIDKGSTDKKSLCKRREDEEKTEENNLSLSYIHSEAASQPEEPASDVYGNERTAIGKELKNKIALYFMKKYKTMDIDGFVDYCEKLNWLGDEGESIKDNIGKYADRWMEQ